MTKAELNEKYPEYRDEMTVEREKEYVNDCFDYYEQQGFAKVFWSQGGDFKEHHFKPFKVMGRVPALEGNNKGMELDCLPMWYIRFEDGFEMAAYLDECIVSEMIDNGCPEDKLYKYSNLVSG